ncbi:TPA: pathogenicity island 2 effector protein SseB [Salmonella enterica]|nr:pathogenicity island 2 effector protein SseB [Salmonella enterica]
MYSGNIFWGNPPHTVGNNFGISNFDTGGQDDLSQKNTFAEAYKVLTFLLMVIQTIANDKFLEIQKNSERARNTQQKSNEMDEVIARAAQEKDPKTKEEVPEDVIAYMSSNGILIDGMTINQYMDKFGDHGKLDKGGLQAVKATLENDANKETDLLSQGQIIIQKLNQEMNAVLTQLTSTVEKWGTISSMIGQKM